MPSLNFTVFVDKVESGEKRQTIRKLGKRPWKAGDTAYLFTGMRTKKCRRIGPEKVKVRGVYPCKILEGGWIIFSGSPLIPCERERLAKQDGFENLDDFYEFFKKAGLPFEGQVIYW